MAEIAPFKGIRYDPSLVGDPARVLSPPYDVISAAERQDLEARHERNAVRLILPRGDGDSRYAGARRLFDEWLADGTLRRDEQPAVYVYRQSFRWPADGPLRTRSGIIALVRLEPYGRRVVLPHEHTLSAPKEDRIKLLRATGVQLSQILALYRDPEGKSERILSVLEGKPPALDASTPDGCRHVMWPVAEPTIIRDLAALLAPKPVMIGDGHHRYETMLAVRDDIRPSDRPPGESAADWGTMCLVRAEDPGIVVLPTHRLIAGLPGFDLQSLRRSAQKAFEVWQSDATTAPALEAALEREGARRPVFAVRVAGRPETTWLGLRPDAHLDELGPPALARLDVTLLHGLVLAPLLGIDADSLRRQSHVLYTHDTEDALRRVEAGAVQAAFLMNATKTHQVLDACEAGFVLPQKSTYFQPKLATGVVMNQVDPTARVARPE